MQVEGVPRACAAVCREVREHGWQRVILLGDDVREGRYSLKACLAQSGVLVLTPGAQDRAWLSDVCRERSADDETITCFAALLADGMEHGVQALLVSDSFLADMLQMARVEAPMIAVGEAQI